MRGKQLFLGCLLGVAVLAAFVADAHAGGDALAPILSSMEGLQPAEATPETQAALARFDMSPAIFVENKGGSVTFFL